MTRKQIRDSVRTNLADVGISFYSDVEINASIQDAYNEICAKTQCLVKSSTRSWVSNRNYYDFVTDGVTDYLGCIAIFNNNTNQWLRDDLSLRDFDRLRRDWEIWIGEPQFWASHSLKRIAIAPKPASATGTFILWYWANAPTLATDDDVPLIAADMHGLFEDYCTGDLLDTAEEIVKGKPFRDDYDKNVVIYKERCHNLAKAELLLRI